MVKAKDWRMAQIVEFSELEALSLIHSTERDRERARDRARGEREAVGLRGAHPSKVRPSRKPPVPGEGHENTQRSR